MIRKILAPMLVLMACTVAAPTTASAFTGPFQLDMAGYTTAAPKAKTTATSGQRNALRSAESYLDTMAFSKSGLQHQLRFEGYSRSDARWAVNHVRANWYSQAYKSARSYLDSMSFSKSGLMHQLEFEGFTHAQARYGANRAYR